MDEVKGEGKGDADSEAGPAWEAKSGGAEAKYGAEAKLERAEAKREAHFEIAESKCTAASEYDDAEYAGDGASGDVDSCVTPAAACALGAAAPRGFAGFWDAVSEEFYAHCAATGEVVYGVGADGNVLAVDFRAVLWVPANEPAAPHARTWTARTRGADGDAGATDAPATVSERAAVRIQSRVRRALAWARCCDVVRATFWRRWDGSGFYYYEDARTGETQWHRPAVLVGTRRRRSLAAFAGDVDDADGAAADDACGDGALVEYEHGGELEGASALCLLEPGGEADYNAGPYHRRRGRGKEALRAIGRLRDDSSDPYNKPSLDRARPLFVKLDEVRTNGAWKLGDTVQCLDGHVVRAAMVDPYLLVRGAAAKGPIDIIKVMQRHVKVPHVVYFGLFSLQKLELAEDADGLLTQEGRMCILQAYKMISRYSDVAAIVAAGLGVLAQCAQNYAARAEVAKEAWAAVAKSALGKLESERFETVIQHLDRVEKRVTFRPTRHGTEIACNVCRLFAAMAGDASIRDAHAEDGVKVPLEVCGSRYQLRMVDASTACLALKRRVDAGRRPCATAPTTPPCSRAACSASTTTSSAASSLPSSPRTRARSASSTRRSPTSPQTSPWSK